MKSISYIQIVVFMLTSFSLAAQDTIKSKIDTAFCTNYSTAVYFSSPYDTSIYQSEWYNIDTTTLLSINDSLLVNDLDSFILISKPIDTFQNLLLDTVIINLRLYPDINIDIPDVVCYNVDSIEIKDKSSIYGSYTSVEYYNQNGINLIAIDSILKVLINNGDSLSITASYDIPQCNYTIDSQFIVATLFTPISNFSSTEVCFGDTTQIINNSIYDVDSASLELIIEGLTVFTNKLDTFSFLLPDNGDTRNVYVNIQQGQCNAKDTFIIRNELQPIANFEGLKTCENELLIISNLCTSPSLTSTFNFDINGNVYSNYSIASSFIILDTLPNNTYSTLGVIDNNNGCVDSFRWDVLIDSVTYVTFTGLKDSYCERQDESILQGSVLPGGEFSGQFITDFGNGQANFTPTMPGPNIKVQYTYTNPVGCIDSNIQIVDIVYPKPMLILSGLLPAYCEFDQGTKLDINQIIPANSVFNITLDGQNFDSEISTTYFFNPLTPGNYQIMNIYEDINGCKDSLISNTIVNPLPEVELDSIIVLIPGESINIGNNSGAESDVIYVWSDGSESNTLNIDQPGIYVLRAINEVTGCEASDTAKVEYDSTIETELLSVMIMPNPTQDFINIILSKPIQNITLINVFGEVVSINGSISFETNQNGELSLNLSNQMAGYFYLRIPSIGNFLIIKI